MLLQLKVCDISKPVNWLKAKEMLLSMVLDLCLCRMANQYHIQVEPSPQMKETILKLRKQLQAKHYNINAKELPPLRKGEIVRVKPIDRSGGW